MPMLKTGTGRIKEVGHLKKKKGSDEELEAEILQKDGKKLATPITKSASAKDE